VSPPSPSPHALFVDHEFINGDPVEYFAKQSRAFREQLTVEVTDTIERPGYEVALPILEYGVLCVRGHKPN
jgi:hypothetical protein